MIKGSPQLNSLTTNDPRDLTKHQFEFLSASLVFLAKKRDLRWLPPRPLAMPAEPWNEGECEIGRHLALLEVYFRNPYNPHRTILNVSMDKRETVSQ